MPIPCEILYSRSYCIHQSHSCGPLDTALRPNSCRIGAPQSPSVLLSLDWLSSLSFCSQWLLVQHSTAGIGTRWSPLSGLADSISFRAQYPCSVLLNSHRRTSIWIVAPTLHSVLLTPPNSALLPWDSCPQSPSVLLCLDWRCSIWFHTLSPFPCFLSLGAGQFPPVCLCLDCRFYMEFCTSYPPFRRPSTGMGSPQSLSALLSLDFALLFS